MICIIQMHLLPGKTTSFLMHGMSYVSEMNMDLDLNPADFQLCDGF